MAESGQRRGLFDGGTGENCLQDWRGTTCGNWCLRETQADRANCVAFLECYQTNGCGPDTCGTNPDDTCGVNRVAPGMGMAPKLIADQVYQCLACPGTSPVTSCTNVPDTAPCTDNNPCTQGERCQTGACVGGIEKLCPGDQCNEAGTCCTGKRCRVLDQTIQPEQHRVRLHGRSLKVRRVGSDQRVGHGHELCRAICPPPISTSSPGYSRGRLNRLLVRPRHPLADRLLAIARSAQRSGWQSYGN